MFKVAIMFFLIINVTGAFAGINQYSVFGPSRQPFSYGVDYDTVIVTKDFKVNANLIFYVEKINNLGRKYFLGHKLIIPKDTFVAKNYCPVEKIRIDYLNTDSIIIVDRIKNLFSVYKHGLLIYWGPITRAKTMKYTVPGRFQIRNKWRLIYSRKYGNAPMPYALHIIGNVCSHIGAMVGHPDSHGCVRLLEGDAIWLYNWATRGTPILIV